MIEIDHVTKRFPGVVALQDVTFGVERGELHAIVGENGAGKSTLMKILAGVLTEYEGRLIIDGRQARFQNARDAQNAGVSIIHQELNLVEQLSAAANIFLGRELRTPIGLRDDHQMEAIAGKLLAELECQINPRQLVRGLRIGDQQLVEIAKALSLESAILIMDEPTSALSEGEVERLYRVIARLRQRGVTILYISHKMNEVFRLADRITVMRDGRHVRTLRKDEASPREITHLMVGREIEALDLGSARSPGKVVLQVENLSLPWPGHARGYRLRDINFELRAGEIVGIAGLMGAGRTELLETLFGARSERFEGTITLDGKSVRFRHPREAKDAGLALVTEDRKRLGIFAKMNVGENTTICTLDRVATAGWIGRGKERRSANESSKRLGVKAASIDVAITSLSGGNQQKAILGRWLLTQPKVLLLDDPTRGIDVGAKAEIYRLMDQLCKQGLGILVTSSELPELLTVSDRILVLCEGRLTASFPRAEATEQKIMEAATSQLAVGTA